MFPWADKNVNCSFNQSRVFQTLHDYNSTHWFTFDNTDLVPRSQMCCKHKMQTRFLLLFSYVWSGLSIVWLLHTLKICLVCFVWLVCFNGNWCELFVVVLFLFFVCLLLFSRFSVQCESSERLLFCLHGLLSLLWVICIDIVCFTRFKDGLLRE